MTQIPPLGQRLKQWRLAKSWSTADLAAELSLTSDEVFVIERGYLLDIHPSIQERIESLIGPAAPVLTTDEQQMVERVVQAVRAGYVVSLIRPTKVDEGQIVLTFGDE